jgi:hypothetical protein
MTARVSTLIDHPRPTRRAIRRGLGALMGAALAVGLVAPAPAGAAQRQVTFEGTLGRCALEGRGPIGATMTVTLTSAAGKVKARKNATVSVGEGRWSIPCLGTLVAGDRLSATTKLAGTVYPLRSFRVPAVGITLDRVANRTTGKAPKSTWLGVVASRCELDGTCTPRRDLTFKVPTTGTYAKVVTAAGFDPRGGDQATVYWSEVSTIDEDVIAVVDHANRVEVSKGSAVATGYGTPGTTVTVRFLTSGGAIRGTGTGKANAAGRFKVTVRNSRGTAVPLASTNRVTASVASDARITVASTLGLDLADVANDHLVAHCFQSQPYRLTVDDHADPPAVLTGIAAAGGLIDLPNLTGKAPMATGTTLALVCQTPAGDLLTIRQDVP